LVVSIYVDMDFMFIVWGQERNMPRLLSSMTKLNLWQVENIAPVLDYHMLLFSFEYIVVKLKSIRLIGTYTSFLFCLFLFTVRKKTNLHQW